MKKFTALLAGVIIAASATTAQAQDAKDYVLNTASTGGTYHPVGTAISTLSKVKLLPKEKTFFELFNVQSSTLGRLWLSSLKEGPKLSISDFGVFS